MKQEMWMLVSYFKSGQYMWHLSRIKVGGGGGKFSLCQTYAQCMSIFAKKSRVVLGEWGVSPLPSCYLILHVSVILHFSISWHICLAFNCLTLLQLKRTSYHHKPVKMYNPLVWPWLKWTVLLLFHCLNRKWLVVWPNTKHINTI